MRSRRFWGTVLVMATLVAAGSATVQAGPLDQRIVAIGLQYSPAEVTVGADEPLEFTNLDLMPHDVVALRHAPDGKPVFATDVIGTGTTVPVEGLDKLPPGVYDFTCSLHPQMLGTIYLESASG